MQSSFSNPPQREPENEYPSCLCMKLEGIPVQAESNETFEFWQKPAYKQQIELRLTIKFDEQWESLKRGRIRFGLRGGELRLKLEGGEIPYESRDLVGSCELTLPDHRQENQVIAAQKRRDSPLADLNIKNDKNPDQANFTKEQSSEESKLNVCHISTIVSEENPTWIFEQEKGGPVLSGLLNRVKLATLNVLSLPCRVEATFQVNRRDICLTDAQGLWPLNLSRNKRAVLDRLIIQRLLEPKFKPYISRAELQYD
ncbi:MAG: hypothetical protein WA919_26790 [Coleofasciculaceae cyanobacterium]